ncbi:MAG: hypothetical protein NT102_02240 [Caldiserica bacterium]|nr:hypothetical protein [Caldisericota bacterium]
MSLRKGTSIIEAAIAIALMGLILLWSIIAYTDISKQSKTSEDIEIVATLASHQIEYIKALSYANLQSITASSVVQFPSPYDKYGYKYADVTVQQNTTSYLKLLTVQVYKMTDLTVPLIQMDCSFLKNKSDGTNAGI